MRATRESDFVVFLAQPASYYLGAISELHGYSDWREQHPDESILADVIFDSRSRELTGICYPVYKRSVRKWAESTIYECENAVLNYFPHPVPRHLRGYGDGVPVLTVEWARSSLVDSEVAQLAEAAWFADKRSPIQEPNYTAFAILDIDSVLELNELEFPRDFLIPPLRI